MQNLLALPIAAWCSLYTYLISERAGALQMYSGIDNERKNLSVTATLIYEIRYMYKLQINFVFARFAFL